MGVHKQSQEDLGAAVGLTQGQISRKMTGQSAFGLPLIDAIAEHFKITTPELLSGIAVAVSKSVEAHAKAGR